MKFSQKKNFILGVIILLAGTLLGGRLLGRFIYPQNPNLPGDTYQVIKVIDGDTIRINYRGKETRVRLLGLNAPEKGECYYQESRTALKDLVEKKIVRLEKDITDLDKYQRPLRYIILLNDEGDNILVNDYLIRNGFAFYHFLPPDKHYKDLFVKAQEQAKRNQTGLWGNCEYKDENSRREQNSEPIDPDCIIKGNISEKGFGKTYLVPGCDNYNRVKIDTRKGEAYFCTESEAQSAGFRKATNCP